MINEEQMFKAINKLIAKGYVKIVKINGEDHVELTNSGKKWIEFSARENLN